MDEGYPCIHYGQIYTHYGVHTSETISFVNEEVMAKSRKAKPGDVIIADTSENDEDLADAVAWLGTEEIAVSNHTLIYRSRLEPRFLSHFLRTMHFERQKRRYVTGTKVRTISERDMQTIRIPIPSPKEQERIANILDKFDALVNDISSGLPAEIEARRKQYEYYRDKLLTFQEAR